MADKQTPQSKAAEERGKAQADTAKAQAATPAADRPVSQASAEEQAKAAQATSTTKSTASKANLAPAAESGDAAVHRLLAERATADANGDTDALKEIDKQLADHGVQA